MDEEYDRSLHADIKPSADFWDGSLRAENRIQWMILAVGSLLW